MGFSEPQSQAFSTGLTAFEWESTQSCLSHTQTGMEETFQYSLVGGGAWFQCEEWAPMWTSRMNDCSCVSIAKYGSKKKWWWKQINFPNIAKRFWLISDNAGNMTFVSKFLFPPTTLEGDYCAEMCEKYLFLTIRQKRLALLSQAQPPRKVSSLAV